MEKEFRNLYKAPSTARMNFQQSYDSHAHMISAYCISSCNVEAYQTRRDPEI